jgi:hypothetical protein
MNELSAHGEKAGDAVVKILDAKGVSKIAQEDDLKTGSLKLVLYCKDWPVVKLGGKLETMVIPLGEPEKRVRIPFNH